MGFKVRCVGWVEGRDILDVHGSLYFGCGCCWWGRALGGSLRGVGLGECEYLRGVICENR